MALLMYLANIRGSTWLGKVPLTFMACHLQSHMEYLLEVAERVVAQKHTLKGFRVVKETPYLRHFSADLAPL